MITKAKDERNNIYYYTSDKSDFEGNTTDIFDYKWNFNASAIPMSVMRPHMSKHKEEILYVIDTDKLIIGNFDIGFAVFKTRYSTSATLCLSECIENNYKFISQRKFLELITPKMSDITEEEMLNIIPYLESSDSESCKIGVDLLVSTNWYTKYKTVVCYYLGIGDHKFNTVNYKYILNLLKTTPSGLTSLCSNIVNIINRYSDLDSNMCRYIMKTWLADHPNIVPIETEGRSIPKNAEELKYLNTTSMRFQGLLELANLKIIFYD